MPRGTSIYDEANLQERLWQPNFETSICGWWDASDLSTMAFGTGISSWSSKAGATNTLTQATGSAQPVLTPNYRNDRQYAVFNGSRWIDIASPSGFPTGTDALTIAAVSYWNTTTYSWLGALGTDGGTTGDARGFLKFATNNYAYFSFSSTDVTSTFAVNALDATLVGTVPAGSTVTPVLSVSGLDYSASKTLASIGAGFSIGRSYNSAVFPMNGGVGEFLVFKSDFTTYQTRRLEGYLAWKWGIVERLPGTHPFKNRPPMIGD